MPANDFNDFHLLTIAKCIVRARREVSSALLQQRLNIGPVRAGSLLQQMQLAGDVKPGLLPGHFAVVRSA